MLGSLGCCRQNPIREVSALLGNQTNGLVVTYGDLVIQYGDWPLVNTNTQKHFSAKCTTVIPCLADTAQAAPRATPCRPHIHAPYMAIHAADQRQLCQRNGRLLPSPQFLVSDRHEHHSELWHDMTSLAPSRMNPSAHLLVRHHRWAKLPLPTPLASHTSRKQLLKGATWVPCMGT